MTAQARPERVSAVVAQSRASGHANIFASRDGALAGIDDGEMRTKAEPAVLLP
jgi:hypothetical protein